MSQTEDSLLQLLYRAEELPFGDSKDAMLEEVLRHAEAGGFTSLAFQTRLRMVHAYTHGMQPAKLFVPFARCLADYDSNPAAHEPWVAGSLRWQFKHAINAMTKFPEVPLDRTVAALDQMERRYRQEGQSLHAVYAHRHRVAAHIGDQAAADEWYEKWCATPRDDNSDCEGCDPSSKAGYLAGRGRDEEAVAIAEPLLHGELNCAEQPQRILTDLLLPYVRTGRMDQARNAHRRAYRILRTRPQDVDSLGAHLEFCALTGNQARGLELLDRHLGWLDRAPSPYAAMEFAAAAALLLRTVIAAGHGDTVVHRPAHGDRPAADHTAQRLHDELAQLALEIAARFDQRNGTGHQSELVRGWMSREPIVDHLPLSATARHQAPVSPPSTAAEITETGLSTAELLERTEVALHRQDYYLAETLARQLTARMDDAAAADSDPLLAGRIGLVGGWLAVIDEDEDAEFMLRAAAEILAVAGAADLHQVALSRVGAYLCDRHRFEEGLALLRATHTHILVHCDAGEQVRATLRLTRALVSAEAHGLLTAEEAAEVRPLLAAAAATAAGDPVLAGHVATRQMLLYIETREHFLAALDWARTAQAAYREADLPQLAAQASWRLGMLLRSEDDYEAALAAADEAIAEMPANTSVDVQARVHGLRGSVLNRLHRPGEAVNELLTAITLGMPHNLPDVPGYQWDLALSYKLSGQPLDAADLAEEAATGLEALGDLDSAYRCRGLLADLHRELDEPDQALAIYGEIAEYHRAEGRHDAEAAYLAEAADLLDTLDRDALAAERYRQAGDAAVRGDDPVRVAYCRYSEALSLHWSGESERALAALEPADQAVRALADADPDPDLLTWHRARLNSNAARILHDAKRLDEAVRRAADAAADFRAIDATGRAVRTELVHGRMLIELGRREQAAQVLTAALAEAEADDPVRAGLSEALAEATEQGE